MGVGPLAGIGKNYSSKTDSVKIRLMYNDSMSESGGSSNQRATRSESFAKRVESLLEELSFSIQAERPSILFAPYASIFVLAEVEDRLEQHLAVLGQHLVPLDVDAEGFDLPLRLSRRSDRKESVYSIHGLSQGGGKEGANAYRALNIRRELLVDPPIRALFWLTADEARGLSRHAPDFWAFRHRVVEFNRPADINCLGPIQGQTPLQALRAARKTARLSPQETNSWLGLGSLALQVGLLPQARQAYLQSLALEPRLPSGWLGLANVDQLGKFYADAIIKYRQVIGLAPSTISAHIALIACYRLTGQAHLADEQVRAAHPFMAHADEYAQAGLASVCGNTSQAVEMLRRALEKKPVRWNDLRHDRNLDFIRQDPGFLELSASALAGGARGN